MKAKRDNRTGLLDKKPVVFVKRFLKQFGDDSVSMLSNGMVYATLLAVVPCLTLIYAVLNMFGVLAPVVSVIQDYVIRAFGEETGMNVMRYINGFTENAMGMGIVSILSFGVTFVLLIDKIYAIINKIFHSGKSNGNIVYRYLKHAAIIIVGLLAIIAMVWLVGRFNSLAVKIRNLPDLTFLERMLKVIVPIAIVFALMFSLVYFVPNCKVRKKSGILGASAGTVGIMVLVFIFQFIVRKSVKYSIIYGSLASLLFFFMFLSYLWKIVFSAVILTSVHQDILENGWGSDAKS